MGEEWRRGWHPERIRAKETDKPVLIVGAGPAGLEAAQALGKRGYKVALAESSRELGGRVLRESRLPGLSAWIRVRDYRVGQLNNLANVDVYFESDIQAADALELGFPRIAVATGAKWRKDGVGRLWTTPISISSTARVFTPDDFLDGKRPEGKRFAIWDDDHYYMGGALAELLAKDGASVAYITPAREASTWTSNTMEQRFIQKRLLESGVQILPNLALESVDEDSITASCTYTGRKRQIETDELVLVTSRIPLDGLSTELNLMKEQWPDAGIESVVAIGDALAPATIAHAVYAGRRFAEDLDKPVSDVIAAPFKREMVEIMR